MASRPIAPAPPKKQERSTPPIRATLTQRPRLNVPRGRADISISTTGILNPEPGVDIIPPTPPRVEKPADATSFAFVNISKPSQASSRENKRFVKSFVRHQTVKSVKAAKDAALSQKHREPRSLDPERHKKRVQSSASSKGSSSSSHQLSTINRGKNPPSRSWEILTWSHRYPKATYDELMALMGNDALRINRNPYSSNIVYPVEMDRESHELVSFMHCEYEVTKLRVAFRPVWFGLFMKDTASFLQLMSTTILHRGFTYGVKNEAKAMNYRQMAWKSVNDRLADPDQCMTDGVMAAILAFLILDHWLKDMDRYVIDKAGLVRIVELRGGISQLEDNAELRLVMLWDDVGGATSFDIEPSFGLPIHHLPPLPSRSPVPPSPRLLHILKKWNRTFSEHRVMALFHDLFIVTSIMEGQIPDLYDDPLFLGMQINPVVIRLLEFLRKDLTSLERSLCLAAIIYLGDIRVLFCSYHTTGYHFINKLKATLLDTRWTDFHDLRLWISVIGGIKSAETDRPFFIEEIRIAMKELRISTWDQVTEIVESIVWSKSTYCMASEDFGQLIMARNSPLRLRGRLL